MGEECGSHPCCARMGHPFSGWYVLPADVFVVSQVPFLRFAAEMYLGRPFCVLGMLPEKQMRAARDDVGWGRDVVPTLAQPPQGRRPVLGDPGIAQGWGIHFLCPYVFPLTRLWSPRCPSSAALRRCTWGTHFLWWGCCPKAIALRWG